jgi:hypothetical protein
MTPWTRDQPVARPLPAHTRQQKHNECTQTSMPQVGLEPTISVFERAKTCLRHRGHCGRQDLQLGNSVIDARSFACLCMCSRLPKTTHGTQTFLYINRSLPRLIQFSPSGSVPPRKQQLSKPTFRSTKCAFWSTEMKKACTVKEKCKCVRWNVLYSFSWRTFAASMNLNLPHFTYRTAHWTNKITRLDGFWQWCITLRSTGLLDVVQRPEF